MTLVGRGIRSEQFERLLSGAFRQAGLRAKRPGAAPDDGGNLVFEKAGEKYIVQLKVSSEGRSDRLIPLLSQAILQVRADGKRSGDANPLVVVAARRIRPSVARQIQEFGRRYAPEVGVGVIDAEGFRSFMGFGLEALDAKPSGRLASEVARAPRRLDLFSDLNQWMLKILIGQSLPETLIVVPRDPVRNASQLSSIAGVSIMSASRLINQLRERQFLHKRDDLLQIARVDELLDLWISANREAADEVPARWIIKKGPDQLKAALRDYAAPHPSGRAVKPLPRCCLALFAAADALGCGFVHGAPAHIYLESLTVDALGRLGLTIDDSGRPPDLYIRKPANREAVFRSQVTRDGIPVSDILQVWLDASTHPARGKEQAREIQRRVFKRFFGKQL